MVIFIKALILAAGLGLRLAPLTNNIPKALIKVNGKSIVINQIEILYSLGITDIYVVSGYKSELLEKNILSIFPSVNIIKNEDYSTTNNMYSAFLASKLLQGHDFLMMNGDVFIDFSVMKTLYECEHADAIIVDKGNYIDESMKVIEEDDRLVEISKSIERELALGSSIDIYKFSSESGTKFFNKCADYINSGIVKKWSEVALNDILPFCNFKACKLNGRWFEIDDLKDLKAAKEMFKIN